ncbi:type IV secretory system conjugative DNA transfer family protein [Ruegeria halocynthiae]|uniref:type IV secretory system conjugative DNA transfer family protein n=1 Tax=Ruegeria halocynthiae TaxID=985054 RepID=UPI0009439E12
MGFARSYARAADEFLNLAAEESRILRSTISVMNNSGLQLWRNPSVARATQGNDINFEDLRRRPTSIYFSVPGKRSKSSGHSFACSSSIW